MNKKIGILSLPFHRNYGGILQSYALYRVIQKLGYSPCLLNRDVVNHVSKKEWLINIKRNLFSIIGIKSHPTCYQILRESLSSMLSFVDKNIPNRLNFYEFSALENVKFDAVVVGSDQVWRKGYTPDTKLYFLSFLKTHNTKRIAYAASFGVDTWQFDTNETEELQSLAQSFKSVSVREDSAVELCEKNLGVPALQVLDPTLLLTKKDYEEIAGVNSVSSHKKQLLLFNLSNNEFKSQVSQSIAELLSAEVVDFNLPVYTDYFLSEVYQFKSVESWLDSFASADFVLTDSFHGTAFAINFNKPFIAFGSKERGQARFLSLLRMFGLENRLVDNLDEAKKVCAEPIDWADVNERLANYRKQSLDFLNHALADG